MSKPCDKIRREVDADAILRGCDAMARREELPADRIGMLLPAVLPVIEKGVAGGQQQEGPRKKTPQAPVKGTAGLL